MDTIRVRFLLTPAFLLFPWIGLGIDRLYIHARGSSKRHLLAILLVTIFALVPFYRSFKIIWKQDYVLLKAGKWMATVPQFQAARIITTDRRVPFYAGRGADFYFYGDPDYLEMEKFAARSGKNLLILKTPKGKKYPTPRFKNYIKAKEFVGLKDIVSIYCSPGLYNLIKDMKL